MKKLSLIIILVVSFILTSENSYSFLNLTIYGGLSTPNNQMAYVYQKDGTFKDFVNKGINLGWHLGARFKLPLDQGLLFVASLGWNRFPDAQLEAITALDPKVPITAVQDIIPIGAGVQYYIVDKTIKVYLIGELNYNYFTAHGSFLGIPVPNTDLSQSSSRIGFVGGAGVELNLGIVSPLLEFKYSLANLIGKESGELTKSYFMLSIGF